VWDRQGCQILGDLGGGEGAAGGGTLGGGGGDGGGEGGGVGGGEGGWGPRVRGGLVAILNKLAQNYPK
jgi:hypothetical protein